MEGAYNFTIDLEAGNLTTSVGVYMDIMFEEVKVLKKKKVVVIPESGVRVVTVRNYIKSPEYERVVETCDLEQN